MDLLSIESLKKIDLKQLSKEELVTLKKVVGMLKNTAVREPTKEFLQYRESYKGRTVTASYLFPKIGKKQYLDDCECLICVGDIKAYAVDEWQRRLMRSKIDNKSKRYIVELERDVVTTFDNKRDDFIKEMMAAYKEKGYVSFQDLSYALSRHLNEVSDKSSYPVMYYHKYVNDSAVDSAYRKLGYDREGVRAVRRQAQYDPKDSRLRENIDNSMGLVRSVPEEVVNQIKDMWNQEGNPSSIVHTLVKRDEEAIKRNPPSDREMRDALSNLWSKQRYVYQRIVRTESVNLYAKVQLQEWWDQGIREVERVAINDTRTCLLCRELASPGRNVYLIEDLLREMYPVSFMSHPLCRCSYIPRVNLSVFDELEAELMASNPPSEFDVARDQNVGEVRLESVPLEYEDLIRKMVEEATPDSTVAFIPDVVNHIKWQEDMLDDLKEKYPNKQEQLMALQQMTQEKRGKIISYVTKDKEYALISGFAADSIPITAPVGRLKAEQQWDELSDSQKEWVKDRYSRKEKEELIHKEDGMQYVVRPMFVSPLAEIDAQTYFVESYIGYMVNPIQLLYVDELMYNWLKQEFFSKEYLDFPVR